MKDLAHAGVKISSSTVRKRLLESGRRAMRPFKKQLLTKKMKSKRLTWAKKHKTWTVEEWKKVLFSDESHFYVRGEHSRFVRRSIEESLNSHHVNQTVKHPQKKMFFGCFSYAGVGSLFPLEGMMNSDRYIDVIKKVIPNLKNAFPGEGIFQQDLAPCHTSKKCAKFMSENDVKVLDWPRNFPDLNPIENLWFIIKSRLLKKDCATKRKLTEATIEVWYRDEEIAEKCKKLVESMPNRVTELLKNGGGHIKY